MERIEVDGVNVAGEDVYEARKVRSVFWRTPSPEERSRRAACDIFASRSLAHRSLEADLEPATAGLQRLDRAADTAFSFLSRWA